jgi:hypothetical protein
MARRKRMSVEMSMHKDAQRRFRHQIAVAEAPCFRRHNGQVYRIADTIPQLHSSGGARAIGFDVKRYELPKQEVRLRAQKTFSQSNRCICSAVLVLLKQTGAACSRRYVAATIERRGGRGQI